LHLPGNVPHEAATRRDHFIQKSPDVTTRPTKNRDHYQTASTIKNPDMHPTASSAPRTIWMSPSIHRSPPNYQGVRELFHKRQKHDVRHPTSDSPKYGSTLHTASLLAHLLLNVDNFP
jgi:hypothetical protein